MHAVCAQLRASMTCPEHWGVHRGVVLALRARLGGRFLVGGALSRAAVKGTECSVALELERVWLEEPFLG